MANLGADPEALVRFLTGPVTAGWFCPRPALDGMRHTGSRARGPAPCTYSKLARAAGLGWPEVREHRIRELTAEEMRRDGRINPTEAFARLQRTVPELDIPGTEAPSGVTPWPERSRQRAERNRR